MVFVFLFFIFFNIIAVRYVDRQESTHMTVVLLKELIQSEHTSVIRSRTGTSQQPPCPEASLGPFQSQTMAHPAF